MSDTDLLTHARSAIAAHLRGQPAPVLAEKLTSQGVFVTLWADGDLRGCIGHIQPIHATLGEEIVACAVAAAVEDPRFRPVNIDELPALTLELSLLEPPEPIVSIASLDPERYGVVVKAGWRRGVLLPNVDGVDDADQQVAIARRKAGIRAEERVTLERFVVRKIAEPK